MSATDHWFDQLAKRSATSLSRRRMIGLLASSFMAGALRQGDQAHAAKPPPKKCSSDNQCPNCKVCGPSGVCIEACGDQLCFGCVPLSGGGRKYVCVKHVECRSCEVCSGGQCFDNCPPGQTCCGTGGPSGSTCKNLTDDVSNCGVCGKVCPPGSKCISGLCVCQSMLGPAASGGSVRALAQGEPCGDVCCGLCQVCDNGTCRDCSVCETCNSNGQCVPVPNAKPCGDACCGSCQVCDNGVCRSCNACETCDENLGCVPIAGQKLCGNVCVPSDWVTCFRADLGSYCCPPGPMPCSESSISGCT
jgi:hypothetical protein